MRLEKTLNFGFIIKVISRTIGKKTELEEFCFLNDKQQVIDIG